MVKVSVVKKLGRECLKQQGEYNIRECQPKVSLDYQ